MKHFFTLMLLLAATALSSFAAQNKYTLDIDHADRVKVCINYVEQTNLVDGVNVFTFDDTGDYGISVTLEPKSKDYLIVSVKNFAGTEKASYSSYVSFSFDQSEASHYYKIVTKDLNESRTASLTVSVDAPEKLSLILNTSYRQVTFTQMETVVKFDPESETPISLSKDYYDTFYSVKLNGEKVSPNDYGYYSEIAIKDGDKLEVQMLPPDIDYNYTITEQVEGFITDVKVDGTSVEDIHSFKAHAGSKVVIYAANQSDFIFEKMVIGETTVTYISSYSGYEFTASSDADIMVYVRKPAQFTVSFDIDDPDNVKIYQGSNSENPFTLVAGKQELVFTEAAYGSVYVNIVSTANGILKSVLKNGNECFSYGNVYTTVQEGDEFVVVTEKFVRDWTAAIYVKDYADLYYVSFTNQETHTELATLKEGYTTFKCGEVDNPAGLSYYSQTATPVIYVNDELASPIYENSTNYNIVLADQTVIKMFVNGVPTTHTLTYEIADNIEGLSLRRDHVKTISDFSTATTAHNGTVYHLTLADHASHNVTLNGEALTFDEANTAEFAPEADAVLSVAKITDGIENVAVGGAVNNEVYNLQGIRVSGDKLPAGVYIIGGKKTLVK